MSEPSGSAPTGREVLRDHAGRELATDDATYVATEMPDKGLSNQQQRNLERLVEIEYVRRRDELRAGVQNWLTDQELALADETDSATRLIQTAAFMRRVTGAERRIVNEIQKLREYLKENGVEGRRIEVNYRRSYRSLFFQLLDKNPTSEHGPEGFGRSGEPDSWQAVGYQDRLTALRNRAQSIEHNAMQILFAHREEALRQVLLVSLSLSTASDVLEVIGSVEDLINAAVEHDKP